MTQADPHLDPRTADIKFCPRCGHTVNYRQTHGAVRPVCPQCGRIHFIDPKVAVAVVVEREGRLLLIKRGMAPERGKWSLPAGFVDAGEDPAQAAEREALEETHLRVRAAGLLDVIPKAEAAEGADILIVYRAEILDGVLAPGDDAEEARFFAPEELPADLAFASARQIAARWAALTRTFSALR
jgi:ADP-ribose pyrophosphatase YjhB (NUDIX family)